MTALERLTDALAVWDSRREFYETAQRRLRFAHESLEEARTLVSRARQEFDDMLRAERAARETLTNELETTRT